MEDSIDLVAMSVVSQWPLLQLLYLFNSDQETVIESGKQNRLDRIVVLKSKLTADEETRVNVMVFRIDKQGNIFSMPCYLSYSLGGPYYPPIVAKQEKVAGLWVLRLETTNYEDLVSAQEKLTGYQAEELVCQLFMDPILGSPVASDFFQNLVSSLLMPENLELEVIRTLLFPW